MIFTDLINTSGCINDDITLKSKLDEQRKTLCTYDTTLLENKNIRLKIDALSNAPDGRFVIPYKGVDFDCLFKRNALSDKLYVFFSGYRKSGESEPTFKRWSYYNYIEANMLNIDDQMCKLYPKLGLGWYYGTDEESYCDYIVDIINAFSEQNSFTEVIFFASSGGGYAALYCGCKIKGSTVIAINPQIKLNIYPGYENFQNITGLNLSCRDKFNRNYLPEMIKQASETKFLLIENAACDMDMSQLEALCSELGTGFHYGLTRLMPNILLWVYEAESSAPHNAQEYFAMFFAIKYLYEHYENATDFSEVYLIFSELWYDHYNLTQELHKSYGVALQKAQRHVELLQADSNFSDETISLKTIAGQFDVEIPMRDLRFNYIIICDMLEPYTLYKLSVGNVCVLSGETPKFSVVMRDTLNNCIDFIKSLDVGDGGVIYFTTGNDASKKELRIYSGEAGMTNNISLRIGFYQLVKIEIKCKGSKNV